MFESTKNYTVRFFAMKSTKRIIPLLIFCSVMIGFALGCIAEVYINPLNYISSTIRIQGVQTVDNQTSIVKDNKIEEKIYQARSAFNRSELYWLTMNVYHEARGENTFGKLMVALVTLARQDDGRWGDTIKEVVTAPYQFSWYSDGKSDIPNNATAWEESKQIAIFAQKIYKEIGHTLDITHYHNHSVNPEWAKKMEKILVVGNHTFYNDNLTN